MDKTVSCAKCAFFDVAASQGQSVKNDGLCRYNPPVSQPGPNEHGLWPVVSTGDWCGHFANGSAASQRAAE